jgi:hypothetical protein
MREANFARARPSGSAPAHRQGSRPQPLAAFLARARRAVRGGGAAAWVQAKSRVARSAICAALRGWGAKARALARVGSECDAHTRATTASGPFDCVHSNIASSACAAQVPHYSFALLTSVPLVTSAGGLGVAEGQRGSIKDAGQTSAEARAQAGGCGEPAASTIDTVSNLHYNLSTSAQPSDSSDTCG